jgi:WD40 repeat protein/tRNA A-37 threonylcarbamoyl transferase component Bud32
MVGVTVKPGGTEGLSETVSAPGSDASTRSGDRGRDATPDATPLVGAGELGSPHRDRARYQIIGEHGRGGLGRVSRAHDRELGRDIAIKELISRGDVSEVRFLREALITARLEHPGIVPVHEAGRWPDGTPFYAMKLVAGRSLRELINQRTTVDDRLGLLHHVIAVADAIAYAHGRNIIHRDLKPANVIVGDFGETIVIDWGLAKDLSAAEEPAVGGGGALLASLDSGLTSAGSVLGTPAYMAPEQARGEHVDQRADVFAIGAMLWELCALRKVPTEPHQRHRMLRRGGIDNDLAAIIDKALDPDPDGRYPDAGALAADLKAFKAGARIAARDYSLLATLAHWTRRHRTLALAATVALALAVVAAALYVRSIAYERDRADAALALAESSRRAAVTAGATTEAALADQILKHAELLVATDPSAAVDVLAGYRGDDRFHLDVLRAAADGRGVARLRATPHTGTILWVHGRADRSIATQANDGTIAVTSATGAVTVVARDAANKDTRAFGARRQLLAYVCHRDHLCLVDFSQPVPVISPPFGSDSDGLAFSPTEASLAAIAHDGSVTVWDIANPRQPVERYRTSGVGWYIAFLDEDTLATSNVDKLTLSAGRAAPVRLDLPGGMNAIDVSHDRREVVIGTALGTATLLGATARRLGRPTTLCVGPVGTVSYLPRADQIAYGCANGIVGIWDTARSTVTPLATLPGSAEYLAPTADGRELAIAGSSPTLFVLDLESRIVTPYLGHNVRLTAIAAPEAGCPWFLSSDANGNLRAWPRPRPLARVAFTEPSRLFDALILGDSVTAVSSGPAASLHFASPRGVQAIGPHEVAAAFLEPSPDRTRFATYGWGGKIELWSGSEPRRLQILESKPAGAQIVRLAYIGPDDLVWAGNDGHLSRWSSAGGISPIATLAQPITTFAVVPQDHSLVVALADGALWSVTLDGTTRRIETQRETAGALQISSDGRWLATGNAAGVVAVYDTRQWQPHAVLRTSGAIQHIVWSPRSDVIAFATTTGQVHIGRAELAPPGPRWEPDHVVWRSFAAHPRSLAISPDGELLMIAGSDGAVWFCSLSTDRWLYYPTGIASITTIAPAPDGRTAATADSAGRLMFLDLAAVRDALRGAAAP